MRKEASERRMGATGRRVHGGTRPQREQLHAAPRPGGDARGTQAVAGMPRWLAVPANDECDLARGSLDLAGLGLSKARGRDTEWLSAVRP